MPCTASARPQRLRAKREQLPRAACQLPRYPSPAKDRPSHPHKMGQGMKSLAQVHWRAAPARRRHSAPPIIRKSPTMPPPQNGSRDEIPCAGALARSPCPPEALCATISRKRPTEPPSPQNGSRDEIPCAGAGARSPCPPEAPVVPFPHKKPSCRCDRRAKGYRLFGVGSVIRCAASSCACRQGAGSGEPVR